MSQYQIGSATKNAGEEAMCQANGRYNNATGCDVTCTDRPDESKRYSNDGELAAYKDRLEAQVQEFSAKLDAVYHSHSYRIGRMITWPFRKCKACVEFFRSRLSLCRQFRKDYGTLYMLRYALSKLWRRSVLHPYDVVSSIGVNCEVSFNLGRFHGFVDSYPLIWAAVYSLTHLPKLIEDPMSLASDQHMEHDYEHNMVHFPYINVSFHCKGMPKDLLGPDGKIDEKKAQAERDELKSRLAYLAGKWKNLLEDPAKTLLCILTPYENGNTTEEILAIYDALRKYPSTDLLVVLTGREKMISSSVLRSKGIFVRYITRHPPPDRITDIQANDTLGWRRICHEFPPLRRKTTNKVFKYEK